MSTFDADMKKVAAVLRHAAGFVALAFCVAFAFSLIEHRPLLSGRLLDLSAMTVVAAGAGVSGSFGRTFFSALRAPLAPAESLTAPQRSLRRQYRAVFWLGMVMFSCFAAILFLLAISIGTGHGEWAHWLPAGPPRDPDFIDLLFR